MNQSKSKILIVDDYEMNIDILQDFLEDEYHLMAAASGEEALAMVSIFEPDLIILDIMMPGIDGFEVCKRLRRNMETRHIPVIFLSAKTAPADIVRGFESGGSDYIIKPFHYEEVCTRVRIQLELVKNQKALLEKAEAMDRLLEQRTRDLLIKEREAALSQTVVGVVHNLKGPLTAIVGVDAIIQQALHGMQESLTASKNDVKDLIELMSLMHDSVEDLSSMVDTLAKKGRQHADHNPMDSDMNEILATEIALLEHDLFFKHRVTLDVCLAKDPLPLHCIASELGHLFFCIINCLRACLNDEGLFNLHISSGISEGKYFVRFFTAVVQDEWHEDRMGSIKNGENIDTFQWSLSMASRLADIYNGHVQYTYGENGSSMELYLTVAKEDDGPAQ